MEKEDLFDGTKRLLLNVSSQITALTTSLVTQSFTYEITTEFAKGQVYDEKRKKLFPSGDTSMVSIHCV